MIRARIFNGMLISFVVLFYIFNDSYFAFLLFAVTILLFLISFVFMFIFKNKVDITIDSSSSVYKNQLGRFHVHIVNRSFLPITKLKYHVQTYNVLIDEQTSGDFYFAINGKSDISVPVSVESNSAGKIILVLSNVRIYDFFGNFSVQQSLNKQAEMFILPIAYDLQISQEDRASANSIAEVYMNEDKGLNTYDITGFKEYEAGDNLKKVHWKLSSKVDDLVVKEVSKPKESSYFVLLEPVVKGKNVQEVNKLVEIFYSLSFSMINSGQEHSAGWFEADTGQLKVMDIHSLDQLNFSLRDVLSMSFQHDKPVSLDAFIHSEHSRGISHLFYIKSSTISELASSSLRSDNNMQMTTLECTSQEKVIRIFSAGKNSIITPKQFEKADEQVFHLGRTSR